MSDAFHSAGEPGAPVAAEASGSTCDAPERVVAAAQRLAAARFVAESAAMHLREYRGVEVDRNELIFVFNLLEESTRNALEELYAAYPGFGKVIGDEVPR